MVSLPRFETCTPKYESIILPLNLLGSVTVYTEGPLKSLGAPKNVYPPLLYLIVLPSDKVALAFM
jgi:hypothetical protein